MSDPRAFVSFDFDNNQIQKVLFAGQAKSDSPTPFTVHDWSSKTALAETEWEKLVKQKMASTNMCIVLVGKSMSTATGVAKARRLGFGCSGRNRRCGAAICRPGATRP
jgi:hypothetical protein